MSQITISINTENDVFLDSNALSEILHNVANKMRNYQQGDQVELNIRDQNGNTVGQITSEKPIFMIHVEGGVVQGISCNLDKLGEEVYISDADIEGTDPKNLAKVDGTEANVFQMPVDYKTDPWIDFVRQDQQDETPKTQMRP